MRGQNTLFNHFIENPVSKTVRKGRSADMIALRDECLLHRYYYYIKLQHKRYDAAVQELSKEFYIKNSNIIYRMQCNSDRLETIMKKEQPDLRQLRLLYPWLTW
ncbi:MULTISPECIES: hypothetical protein [unclassified Chitinophaga]|jgi:hypothetical protein|uniref:hypothetical protein n=1 Tax=unclassified Chitinophaga TaxID=2619133 RepID=UPI0009FAAAE1|nr:MULTISPECIES: hypothetical protein [unclassified Chitinophaga]WPV66594.1 hypothetical protein QQL36_32895 [Chitinophaga sp. LS1]